MKNNKGFTLVELLAVIAILAILVIIALPNVLDMFNQAKIGTFVTEAQTVFKSAQQDYLLNNSTINAFGTENNPDDPAEGETYICKKLNMTGNTKLQYFVKMDAYGLITDYYVYDSTYAYYYHGTGLKIEKIEEEATDKCKDSSLTCGLFNKADTVTATTYPGNASAVTGYNYVKGAVDTAGAMSATGKNPCK